MSTAAPEYKTDSPYLASLQSLFEDRQPTLQWLVIAHNDPALVRRLSEVVDNESAAMLQIPQSSWDLDRGDLPVAVKWSIDVARAERLLLVGHSQAAPQPESASWIGDELVAVEPADSLQSSYQRLLGGANQVQHEIQQSKDHFAAQVAHLCEIEEVQRALAEGRLQLHALFYVSQGGTFLLFDLVTQTFKPLNS